MSFSFSQISGSSGITIVTVSATSTTELESIVENFTLANDTKSVLMPIVQNAYAPLENYIIFKPNSLTVDSSGGTSSLQIQSNDNWEIVSDDWIQLTRYETANRGGYNSLNGNGNTIVGLRFNENTGSTRNGGISGYCKSDSAISATTTIEQGGSYETPYIRLDNYTIYIPSSGMSAQTIAVESNVGWTTSTDSRWIDIDTQSGSSNGIVYFNVQENEQGIGRIGTITLSSTTHNISAECEIGQSAVAPSEPYIIISPTAQTVSLDGGSFTISVSSNTNWDVSVVIGSVLSTPWVSVDKLNGYGDDDITVTINAVGGSSEIANRSAYIAIYNNDNSIKTECNITQEQIHSVSVEWTTSGNEKTANITAIGMEEDFWVCELRDTYVPVQFQSMTLYFRVYLTTANTVVVMTKNNAQWTTLTTLGSNETYTNNYGLSVTNQMFTNQISVQAISKTYNGVPHSWTWIYQA